MKSKPHKSGFALVIALSLMAFVLLLLLSITTLVQVESRLTQNTQQQTQARMNALLGLQQALGELQKAAGHDQRVTATGDLWATPAVGTEHLVGVWSSEDADGDGQPDGAFQRWLVSNDDDNAATPDAKADSVNFVTLARPVANDGSGGYTVTNPDFVALVAAGSVAQDDPGQSPQAVVAQKRSILAGNGQSAGNYAWWVGDNGVKATITQADPYASGQRTGTDWAVNANMLSMQGSTVSALSDFASLDLSDETTVERLQRSAGLSAVELVDSAITSDLLKQHFHDLTTTSLGLQTNTRHGGLKRDLSLLFEMSDSDFDDPNGNFMTAMAAVSDKESEGAGVGGEGLVYEVPEGARWVDRGADKGYALIFKEPVGDQVKGDGVIYGPTWDMLRSYYRLYKGVDNKSSIPTLQDGWAQTYQPSKASMKDWGQLNDRNENKMARYSLVAQGIRHEGPRQSPELVRSTTVLKPQRWVSGVGSDADYYPIRATRGSYLPYLTRMTMSYGITSVRATPTADTYDLDIIWQPMLTFHNPYNVSIDMPRMRYATGMEFMKLHIKHTSGIVPDLDDVPGPDWNLKEEYEAGDAAKVFNYPNDSSPDRVMIEKGKELVFEMPATNFGPGEVKVFSVSGKVINAGDPFYVTMTTNIPEETDGVRFNLPSASASSWKANAAPDLNGLIYNIPAGNEIRVRLQVKKETKFALDVENVEVGGFDNLIYYRTVGSRLFGNVKWDGQPQDNFEGPVQNLVGSVIPNLVMDFFIKPLTFDENLYGGDSITNVQDNRKVYPNFIATNPMAASFHDYGNGSIERQTFSSLYHCYAERFTSPSANHPHDLVMNTGDGSSSWGYNHGNLGPQRSILLDLPIAPMQSIGQFQHATTHSSPYFPVMAVGHSFASPFVPYTDPGSGAVHDSDKYSKGWANGLAYTFERTYENASLGKVNEYAFYDMSYLLNEVLWDGYYFSSIAPDQSMVNRVFADTADAEVNQSSMASSLSSVVDEVVAGDRDLANARMRLFESSPIGGSVTDDLKDFRYSAQHLAVSGSFNVNSTSVSAWTALLSGYRDALIKANDDGSVSDVDLASDESGFPGMSLAPGGATSSSTSITSDAAWAGFMKLSDEEVQDLAEEIVAEIKERAAFRSQGGAPQPVLSLGEFVNRINTDDTRYSRLGILQQAIEDSELNDGLTGLPVTLFETKNFNVDHSPKPYDEPYRDYYPDANYSIDVRNVSPLALTQGDILQAIGPAISARSDTFTIRSYGEVNDPVSGAVISQVWCEAVVQRTTQELEADSNQRRFEVVSFRLLKPDEI